MDTVARRRNAADLPDGGGIAGRRKRDGVVYTPDWVVAMVLEGLPPLRDAAICDPACGDGQFLVAVAERVCRAICECGKGDRGGYYKTLGRLTGMDIDGAALGRCRERLDAVVQRHGCRGVDWNLRRIDALERAAWDGMVGSFDAVVGNPPYIRVQHLEAARRDLINGGHWRLMKGCTDMYILFFELGLGLLRDGGMLAYITPNSWMKSQSGALLRQCLRERHAIRNITDFAGHQVFADATTYTAITQVCKGGGPACAAPGRKCIGHVRGVPQFAAGSVNLAASQWSLMTESDARFLAAINARPAHLGEVAAINVGIQTLADEVFIMERGSIDIERGITRRVVKASVMKGGRDRLERIVIYPYNRQGRLLPEHLIADKYPKAHAWLCSHRERLMARDKGAVDPRKWHGFGREVSIVSGFGDKILTSAMNRAPNFQRCPDPDALFYSGYAIRPRPGVSLRALLRELNSDDMERYIKLVSRPYRNGWYSYAKSFIKSFPLSAC